MDESSLPSEVLLLRPRQREIAVIVYGLGEATAKEIGANLSKPIRNASIRSMTNRLVAKGVLKRTLVGQAYVYAPTMTQPDRKMLELRRFADDHFDGSVLRAALAMKDLIRSRRPPLKSSKEDALRRFADDHFGGSLSRAASSMRLLTSQ